jgi:uncharacterized protein
MSSLANFDFIFLFFVLGLLSSWIKSDLRFSYETSNFLAVFLLLSLGLKGGHEVRALDGLGGFFVVLSIGLASCLALPAILFFMIRRKFGGANSAALVASYGSVSAVTFVTAQSFLESSGLDVSGYMVAVMALMEIPAILLGLYFYQKFSISSSTTSKVNLISILSGKSVLLLLGGFAIGLTMNSVSWTSIAPVFQGCFKGVLALFLLDLGLTAQKKLREAWSFKTAAIVLAIFSPLFFGSLTLILALWMEVPHADRLLLAVLVGSASYIAAPAAIRSSIPEANPSLYLALPLALTFPMNLLFGIQYYIWLSGSI